MYFTFTFLALFSISQLWVFDFSSPVDLIASILAIFLIFLLPIFALSLLKNHSEFTLLYARKFLIAAIVVISRDSPIYIVGVISVCNLTAGILMLAYKLEKWRV